MTSQALPKKIQISDNVLFQQIGGECILLDMQSEQYFGLDETGARIWEILSENGDTEVALARMLSEYEVDEATLKNDMYKLLCELENEKLISFV